MIGLKVYPNGLTATTSTDEGGERTQLRYVKASNCGATCEWLLSQARVNVHGQQVWQNTTTQAGPLSKDDYAYDAAGRLKHVEDRAGTSNDCTTRAYSYDADSNRTRLQTFAPGAGGACQTTTSTSTTDTTYDEADRVTTTGVDYDAFGRTLTVPAAAAGGAQLTSTYYANDLARTLSQDGTTRTYTLDPARRVSTRDTTLGSTTTTETNHYSNTLDNGLDSPSWIAENASGSVYTRMIEGIDGDLAAIRDTTSTRLQLTNLHDDVIAEAPTSPSKTVLTVLGDNTEFGEPRQQTSTRRRWRGGKQRSTELKSGTITMGVRTYIPQLGRFLQTDPVLGGSANDYDYTNQDPVNVLDLDGRINPCGYSARRIAGRAKANRICRAMGWKPLPKPRRKPQRLTMLGRHIVCDIPSMFIGGGVAKVVAKYGGKWLYKTSQAGTPALALPLCVID